MTPDSTEDELCLKLQVDRLPLRSMAVIEHFLLRIP